MDLIATRASGFSGTFSPSVGKDAREGDPTPLRSAPAIDRGGCSAKRHGDWRSYTHYRCRCPDAREDARLYRKRLREGRAEPRRIDSTGTARRLRALAAVGHTFGDIGARLGGVSAQSVREWTVRRWVSPETAAGVVVVYDKLWDKPGPSFYGRVRAQQAGWAVPMAWDDDTIDDPKTVPNQSARGSVVDEVAIRRAVRGQPVKLTQAERREAARRRRENMAESRQARRASLLQMARRLAEVGADSYAVAIELDVHPDTARSLMKQARQERQLLSS